MLGKLKKSILIILVLALFSLCGCAGGYTEHNGVVFGSMEVSLKVDCGKNTIQKMLSVIEEVDNSVSLTKDSYLKRFNSADINVKVEVDEHIYAMLNCAKTVYEQTDGAFNPTVSALSKAWGVDNEGIKKYCYGTEKPSALPLYQNLQSLSVNASPLNIIATEENGKYYLKKTQEVTLDFGGLAKGYCADLLKTIAKNDGASSALISISGNLMLVGKNLDTGNAWRVGVKHPRSSTEQFVCGITASDLSIVTSGDYERYYEFEGLRINHIINPFSLCPVGIQYDDGYRQSTSYITSVTVVGESSMLCDAYSTAVMVLGIEEGAKLLEEVGYSGIIFTSDKKCKVVGDITFTQAPTLYETEYELL